MKSQFRRSAVPTASRLRPANATRSAAATATCACLPFSSVRRSKLDGFDREEIDEQARRGRNRGRNADLGNPRDGEGETHGLVGQRLLQVRGRCTARAREEIRAE